MVKTIPKVSINICTYNRWNLLDKSLKSIFAQNGVDFEVIVIDDGGTDDTKKMIKKYPKVRYKYYDNMGYLADGSSKPYNLAAEMSKGKIIIQQNAECFHHSKNVIKELVRAVKKHHPVFATVINTNADPYQISEKTIKQLSGEQVATTIQYSGVSRKAPWFFCGAIMRKDWNDLGGYKVQQSQVDVEFGERMIANGYTFDWLEDVIVIHQTHEKG